MALIDIALAFGWVTATMRGAREPEPLDVKEINRLMRSNNGASRSQSCIVASIVSRRALPAFWDLRPFPIGGSIKSSNHATSSRRLTVEAAFNF